MNLVIANISNSTNDVMTSHHEFRVGRDELRQAVTPPSANNDCCTMNTRQHERGPTPESLAFRACLAALVSPLRRVRPRVPFNQLAAHRIPTLWTLYRGLLRHARGENTRFRITMLFQQHKFLTSPRETHKQLTIGHKWLDIFRKANEGDARFQSVLDRYDRMVGVKREKEYWKRIIQNELVWQDRLRHRPILTGGYLRGTLYNPPLPRLSPQPHHITRLILQRRRNRTRRQRQYISLQSARNHILYESKFESALSSITDQPFERVFHHPDEWSHPIRQKMKTIRMTFNRDAERQSRPYPPEMLAAIKRARTEKIANKTRERERERRGEVLACTLRRLRQRPPAHILDKMSPEVRRLDRIARRPNDSEYVRSAREQLLRIRQKKRYHPPDHVQDKLTTTAAEIQQVNQEHP